MEVTERDGRFRVVLDGRELPLDVRELGSGVFSLLHGGASFEVRVHAEEGAASEPGRTTMVVDLYDDEYHVDVVDPRRVPSGAGRAGGAGGSQRLVAPMHGKVVRILVAPGTAVVRGQGLLVMEAMKMENELKANVDGVVAELRVEAGASVNQGALLAVVEPRAEPVEPTG